MHENLLFKIISLATYILNSTSNKAEFLRISKMFGDAQKQQQTTTTTQKVFFLYSKAFSKLEML